jgi:hypothetical protein
MSIRAAARVHDERGASGLACGAFEAGGGIVMIFHP